ncbi:MAG: hypothetical protein LKE39_02400 [Sphaerochaeta sp.]|jgi:hypothetical protein|nr:hypothetical protein [Sphaerochaeta sp.]MCH3919334.1 hypothetical protein [Sphaerochaeta sp.]MCI2075997.1 hypothetical protein [Sphaerochaeta sp.]
MKKQKWFGWLVLALVVMLASCQSTVTVRHLVPAGVNMGSYRTIAVASTSLSAPALNYYPTWSINFDDFGYRLSTGYERNAAKNAAELATKTFTSTLQSSGFFTVLPPEQTDKYLALGDDGVALLKQKGVKAIVTSSISYLDLDERPFTEDIVENQLDPTTKKNKQVVTGKKYYVSQRVTLTFSYLVRDIESGTILASNSFTDRRSRDTEIARRVYRGSSFVDERRYAFAYAPSVTSMISSILDAFQNKIAQQLMPTWKYTTLALMPNKPKEANVQDAYRMADAGQVEQAYALFRAQWDATGHLPSGYNAALMQEAMGNLSDALTLMNQVASRTGDVKASAAVHRMLAAQKAQQEAHNQINGTTSVGESKVTTTQIITGS